MRSRPELLGRRIILTANRYDPHVPETVKEYGVAHLCKPFLLAMREIGTTQDLSESRVSQMHSGLLARLWASFETQGVSPPTAARCTPAADGRKAPA